MKKNEIKLKKAIAWFDDFSKFLEEYTPRIFTIEEGLKLWEEKTKKALPQEYKDFVGTIKGAYADYLCFC